MSTTRKYTALLVAVAVSLPLGAGIAMADTGVAPQQAGAVFKLDDLPTTNYNLSARFGQRGSYWSSGRHTGLDFAASSGTRVDAAKDGKVVFSGYAGSYGNAVVIKHRNGWTSLYAHLSKRTVKRGQTVTAGQRVGKVGATGNVTGPHLHFEVRTAKGKQVDPAKYLRGE